MLAAVFGVTSTEIGQAALGLLVALVGYFLHRKTSKIDVIVNGRFNKALERIDQLEATIRENGHEVPAGTLALEKGPV